MLFTENTKMRLGYLGTVEGKEMYEKAKNNTEQFIMLYKDNEPDDKERLDMNREFFKINYDSLAYFFFARSNGVDIFVEMPLVYNDELFDWSQRRLGKTRTLFAQLSKGALMFNCTFNFVTRHTHIIILWENSRIDNIWAYNATNEDILKAITEWEAEFEFNVLNLRMKVLGKI